MYLSCMCFCIYMYSTRPRVCWRTSMGCRIHYNTFTGWRMWKICEHRKQGTLYVYMYTFCSLASVHGDLICTSHKHTCYLTSLLLFRQDTYVKLVSEFKLETSISEETKHFCTGFWKVCVHVCTDHCIVALPYKALKRIQLDLHFSLGF